MSTVANENLSENQSSERYQQIVKQAGLAEHSPVKGCMVIKPYGYAIWENIQAILNKKFKATGHQNAYFPMFIPKSFLSAEASHIEGFAKECAVVTHYRLKNDPLGGGVIVDPEAKLEEELIVRPTSETIIWDTYRRWIQSYRDLPILINQWANVVRWEMRTRLFLRTTEFLWQEGHTAHATAEEAMEETLKMLDVYASFAENFLAIPVMKGIKTANERFAGAVETYCIEGLMRDNRAIQMGTSHFLGQNFAKAFNVKFADKSGQEAYVWATSWGVSTRLIGSLILAHSDAKGLVLPPKIAPIQVVIVPIFKNLDELQLIQDHLSPLLTALEQKEISFKLDKRDTKIPKEKFTEYEMMGVPVRVTIGPRELEQNTLEIYRRDTGEKLFHSREELIGGIEKLLKDIQESIYLKALQFRESQTYYIDDYSEFKQHMKEKGGFVMAHWDGSTATELKIKEDTRATIRCIPIDGESEPGHCIFSGNPSTRRVVFAKAY